MSIRRFPHAAAVAALLTFATGALAQQDAGGGPITDGGTTVDLTPTITFGPAATLRSTTAQSSVTLVVNDPGGNANGAQVTLTPFPADLALTVCQGGSQCSALPMQLTLTGANSTSAYVALTVTTPDTDYRVGTIRAAVLLGGQTYYAYLPVQTGAITPAKLTFLEDPPTVPFGRCTGPRDILFSDAKGHPAFPDQTANVLVSISNGIGVYTDPQCTNAISGTNPIHPKGAVATFYFKPTNSGSAQLGVSVSGFPSPGQQQVTVPAGSSSGQHISVVTPARVAGTGSGVGSSPKGCSEPIFVELRAGNGTPIAATEDVLLNYSGSAASSKVYGDPDCTVPISKLSFQGVSRLPFYFASTVAKAHSVQLSAASGTWDATAIPVVTVGGKASQLIFTKQPLASTVNVAVNGPPQIALGDVDGNVVPPAGSATFAMLVQPNTLGLSGTTNLTSTDPLADTATFSNIVIATPTSSAVLTGKINVGTVQFVANSNAFAVTSTAQLFSVVLGSPAPRCGKLALGLTYGGGIIPSGNVTVSSPDSSNAHVVLSTFGTIDPGLHKVTGPVRLPTDGGSVGEAVVYEDDDRDAGAVTITSVDATAVPHSNVAVWDSALPSLTLSTVETDATTVQAGGEPVNVVVNLLDDCGEPLQTPPDVPVILKTVDPLSVASQLATGTDLGKMQGQVALGACSSPTDTVQFKVLVNGKPLTDASGNPRVFSLQANCTPLIAPSVDIVLTSENTAVDLGATTHFTVQVTGDASPAAFNFTAPGFTLVSVEGGTISGQRVVLNDPHHSFTVEARADSVPQGGAKAQISVSAEDSAAHVIGQSNVAEIQVRPAQVNLGCSTSSGGAMLIAMLLLVGAGMRRRAT